MKKLIKNVIIGGVITGIILPSVGCGQKPVSSNNSALAAEYTIAELKAQFGTSDSKYMFKPFYNVEQNTKFTFNFNSNVDPVKAVTVHTDSKCEEASTVYQTNDGYKTELGVAVVVKPGNAVLGTEERNENQKNIWGYAPIYYLCVRYDLDSLEVKKLDEPIIIPFTVKHKVSTPNAYIDIDSTGTFSVKWLPVENAVSYKIYTADIYTPEGYTLSEIGYTKVRFKLLDTVDASCLEYVPKYRDFDVINGEVKDIYNDENLLVNKRTGAVEQQNANNGAPYFITAIDSNGNESAFSEVVSDKEYSVSLPNKMDGYFYKEYEFLETVLVRSIDGKTSVTYPINYYRNEIPAENATSCEYRYEIVGTKLTGTLEYSNLKSSSKDFPEQVISSYQKKTIEVDNIPEANIPDVTLEAIVDDEYKDSTIDLSLEINYPESAKIQLDPASLMRRADMEVGRIIGKGLYLTPLDSIETYVLTDNLEYIYSKENGVITVKKAEKTDTKKTNEDVLLSKKVSLESKPAKKIDSSNYVEEQRKSTYKQVKEADKEIIKDAQYPIYAETAGQKYLALCLIEQQKEISLKAFPEYQNIADLIDDLYYVWYQNPYIMGINPNKVTYVARLQKATVEYNVTDEIADKQQKELYSKSNEIVKSIIKDNMTDHEKIVAIWDYLETSSSYNYEAVEYVSQGNSDYYKKYPNAWNAYGVLNDKIGVCQSYASAFNMLARLSGLETVMVSGTLNNGGHAWNAVKLDGKWYMIDLTNNSKALGIPYWICNSSTEFILTNGFALNDKFVSGDDMTAFTVNDTNADWYNKNNALAETISDVAKIWKAEKESNQIIVIKYGSNNNASEVISQFKTEASNLGCTSSEIDSFRYTYADGMFIARR